MQKVEAKRRLTEKDRKEEDAKEAAMTDQEWGNPVIDDVEALSDLEAVRFGTQRASGGAIVPKRTQLAIAARLLGDGKVSGAMKERLSGKCSGGKADTAHKAAHAIASMPEVFVTMGNKRKAEDIDEKVDVLSDHLHSS